MLASKSTHIKVAHSPDADDKLMFWALRHEHISTKEFTFDIVEADTHTLNQWAEAEDFDIIAISAAQYLHVADIYQPLVMGSSVGAGYGPIVVIPQHAPNLPSPQDVDNSLQDWTLLTPGTSTTAHNCLTALGYQFGNYLTVPIQPISLTFERLAEVAADHPKTAALLIHEGRLVYEAFATRQELDLGEAWKKTHQANLPLGINVIRRALPEQVRRELSRLLESSMAYGLQNMEEFAANYSSAGFLKRDQLMQYLDLYANETTLRIQIEDQRAFDHLLKTVAHNLQLPLPHLPTDWI